ncbi:hypothetical protein, partial [Methanocorpusculum bavaricum]|uniref:hypothetical protein n=1 Tax=Methanocorpusculum bavaricum TaxID=71518 RepID=UPI001B7FD19A
IEIDLFSIAHNIHESVQWIHLALDSRLNVLIIDEGEGIVVDRVPICTIIQKRDNLCCLRRFGKELF